ncbi:MAG: phosphonate ABC transporter substrate-binding protein [Planctomycetota bacterium]
MTSTKILQRPLFVLVLLLTIAACDRGGGPQESGSLPGSVQKDEISFGIIATESTVGLRREFDPFLQDMSESLGLPVKSYFASDYAGVIEAMRFGKVDLGWFGNKSAIEAADRAGGEVFAQTVPASGQRGYWSTIIVHVDSPYQSIESLLKDADDLSFGNGDPHSTSGFLFPSYFLWRERGIDPRKTFKSVVNSNHETNALSVVNRHVDFATCSTEVLEQIQNERPDTFRKLRVIWKSPLIPADPFVWRKDLPVDLKQRIRKFIFDYGREGPDHERQLEVLAGISGGWAPFEPSSDDQLLPLREMILANKIEQLTREKGQQAAGMKRLREQLDEVRSRREQLLESTDSVSESAGTDRE